MTTVLGSTRLAARLEIVTGKHLTGSLQGRTSHTGNYIVVSSARSLGYVLTGVERIERFTLYLAHHMRHIVITSVGNSSTQVGYLQRCQVHLTLSDRDTDDGKSVP